MWLFQADDAVAPSYADDEVNITFLQPKHLRARFFFRILRLCVQMKFTFDVINKDLNSVSLFTLRVERKFIQAVGIMRMLRHVKGSLNESV